MILKPDFSCGDGGIVDPDFIPASVRDELMLHLVDSPLTELQKVGLLDFANNYGQMLMRRDHDPGQLQRAQIKAIEANARRLLASLNSLGKSARESLHAHTDYLAYGSAPPVELDEHIKDAIKQPHGSMLDSSWDWIAALEKAAAYTVERYEIDRQSKPEQMRARGFVSLQAEQIRNMTGELPPKDRSGWFAGFAECLGKHLGHSVGPRIVASGIDAAR